MANQATPFWKTVPLDQMSDDEWESLCDGCGKCCLIKFQDEDTLEVHYTSLACKLLNTRTCRCRDYNNRKTQVPECLVLRPLTQEIIDILPSTCSYRLLYQGDDLPRWHPLVTGDAGSTTTAGMSLRGRVICESQVHPDDFENYIID